MSEEKIKEITALVAENFRTFGGGRGSEWNPIAAALADEPAQFAAGVDVKEVVEFILGQGKSCNGKS